MKKIVLLFIGILIAVVSFGQVLNAPQGIKYKGTLLTPSAAQLNRVDATSSIQGQLSGINSDLNDYVTYPSPSTSGNVMTSNSVNWISAKPIFGDSLSIFSSSPVIGNIYINSVNKKVYYFVSGYWHRISILDSLLYIPSVLSGDGHTLGLYISSELSTLTKDGSNKVTSWRDYLGSGHNLVNDATADFTPTWSSTGIAFDGVYNYLAGTFTNSQPCFIYMVVKIASTNADYSPLFNGVGGYTNGVSQVAQMSTTPVISLSAGTTMGYPAFIPDTYIILRYLINGASSKITVNTGTSGTGNAGTNNMGGFTIGSDNGAAYAGGHSKLEVKEIILRNISDSDANQSIIVNYLKVKYGLSMWWIMILLPMLLKKNRDRYFKNAA
jgi:hypothetical protein